MKGFVLALVLGLGTVTNVNADQCSSGACSRGPVRSAVASVVKTQPVRSTVRAVAQARPVRTTIQRATSIRPIRGLFSRIRSFGCR